MLGSTVLPERYPMWRYSAYACAILAVVIAVAVGGENSDPETRAKDLYSLAQEHVAKGDYIKAIDSLNQAIGLSPNVDFYLARAAAYWELDDFDKAITDSTAALAKDPKNSSAYFIRGGLYAEQENYNRAIADLTHAIDLDSTKANYFVARAAISGCLEKPQLGIADFNEAIRLEPENYEYLLGRAMFRHGMQDWENLDKDTAALMKISPNDWIPFALGAKAKWKKSEYISALVLCRNAVALNNDPVLQGRYACYLGGCPGSDARDFEAALKLATESCERTEWKDSSCLEALAYVHYVNDEFEDALKWQSEAIRNAPEEEKTEKEYVLRSYKNHEKIDPPVTQKMSVTMH